MKKTISIALFLLTLLLPAFPQAAGGIHAGYSYIFVSPNTRSSLTDHDAEASLTSFEQINAIAVADRIGCSLTQAIEIASAIGVYNDSSENSVIIESNLKQKSAEYVAALLGRYAHQEFVLIFIPAATGKDKLWTITSKQTPEVAITAARELHLSSLTITRAGDQSEIWIVDSDGKSTQNVKALAEKLKGTALSQDGTSEIFGDPDRLKAARQFDQRITAFENHAAKKLSAHLWSRQWRDVTTRTCSKETVN